MTTYERYQAAKAIYREMGVDTDAAIEAVKKIPISIHCWQGDDVLGFLTPDVALSGGIQTTGNYPGRARTAEELRRDMDFAMKMIPGKHRVNLHAIYADTVNKANAIRDQIHGEADEYDRTTRERAQKDSEAMIADAQTRAEAILFNAQQQAQKMVDENEITRRAQAYAMETRERAEKDADSIYNQACVHADKMLSGAAAALSRSANDLAALRDNLLGQHPNA